MKKIETAEIKRQLEINHESLVIHQINIISKDSRRNRIMKIEINHDADTIHYVHLSETEDSKDKSK